VNLLLHCCCGPCAATVADHFRSLGDEVTGWFYNPNIHPAEEHRRREATFEQMAKAISLPVLRRRSGAGLLRFLLALAAGGGRRCQACYELRLRATAREAAVRGFDAFSTTLLISPYQDVPAIGEMARALAERMGVQFRFADLRSRYPESCHRAQELDLYRQNYCGCLFSRLERSERRLRRAIGKVCTALA